MDNLQNYTRYTGDVNPVDNLVDTANLHPSDTMTGSTGSPKSLAKKLNISERQLYRLIQNLKDSGFPISFSKSRNCYYYESTIQVTIELNVEGDNLIK